MRQAMLTKCVGACKDAPLKDQPATLIRFKPDHDGNFVWQVARIDNKKAVAGFSARPFEKAGKAELAEICIRVLSDLFDLGATPADINRIKQQSLLGGVVLGRRGPKDDSKGKTAEQTSAAAAVSESQSADQIEAAVSESQSADQIAAEKSQCE